ncbi:MAG: VCBS repeat-containing protein, partial [Aurantibacter sp.]
MALILLVSTQSCTENSNSKDSDLISKNKSESNEPNSNKKVFEKLDPSQSGIIFSNDIAHNIETFENLFDFDYFYNGAGVGVEDLNNDGLLDIFFCGNQVPNKLFLNKGSMAFQDVSDSANINTGKIWSNGITFVDINNDGYKDIYISQGGPNTRPNRKNLLFINNQDLTFTESAESYGLADMGITTQSAFFDFDKDGDLDCLVMNENELYGVDPINLYKMIDADLEAKYFNSSHLYRNDKGKFVDITKDAGLQRPIFGLGLAISDINADGWLDIYIASDYYIPDAMFMNNGNGTFSDKIKEFTKHTAYYGMGIDIADVDNDALQDIFVLDMASSDHVRSKTLMASMSTERFDYLVNKADFHHQYMFNALQLNRGNNQFDNVSQLSETANTDWSWTVLLSDYDNDETKDIFITNGYRRYALDNDLQRKVFEAKMKYRNNVPIEVKRQLYEQMPSEKLPNIVYSAEKNLQYKDVAKEWGLADFSFSNGAAQGDLDNDGDLDLIVNNIDENAFLYQNMSVEKGLGNFLKVKVKGKTSEVFAKVKISYSGKSQLIETKRVRGYMSAQEDIAHFGLGTHQKIDTLSVFWPNGNVEERFGLAVNQLLEFNEDDAKSPKSKKKITEPVFKKVEPRSMNLDFVHAENNYDDFETEILLPYKQSNQGPFISKGDINGDGKSDLFIGGASGQAGSIYLQTSNGFKKKVSKILEADAHHEDMESIFFDFDNDKDLDLFVVSGGNEFQENSSFYADRLYLNNGSGTFTKFESEVLTSFTKSGKTVAALDFDKDGDQDILVGNRIVPKNYPKHSPSILYENDNGKLKDVTSDKASGLQNFGIVNSVIATDFNNDGWKDFIAVGEWSTIGFFENRNGIFTNISPENDVLQEKGWWYALKETDVNNDGLKDYIVGNVGLNLKFKADGEKPFKIYANDFDGDGTNDIVLSKKYKGEYVPVRGRECSSQQMPFIKNKFPTYGDFAKATLLDVYGEKLKESVQKEATEFRSILLLNKGQGNFEKKILPIEAQLFPILDIVLLDINKDGFEDCIIAGNIYETEVETPRLDAISGQVLISNGKDGYRSANPEKMGLYLEGNVKSIELINT